MVIPNYNGAAWLPGCLGGLNAQAFKDFIELGEGELARARRHKRALSVLSVKLDRYDALLAEHGDDFADQVRGTVARILSVVLRVSDLVGQGSGQCFSVILPETSVDYAAEVGERVRAAFEDEDVFTGAQLVVFTVSVGAVGLEERDGDFTLLYDRAVAAKTEAATQGGNRVCRT